jgi:dTDP-glucose 4,6-dehydratase
MTGGFLVIGSNSFSGAHFVRHLIEQGHQVLGVSRSEEPDDVFLPYKLMPDLEQQFWFEQIDLNQDLDRLMDLIHSHRPSHVVNFAAQGMVAQSWDAPEHWYQTNVVAQVRLHDRLRQLDFLDKYVHVSTPEVYGSTDGLVAENFEFAPSTPYAVSRAACDLHLLTFYEAYGFPVVFTRAANVYGPGQQLYRIIPRAMLSCRLGRRLQLHGGGGSVRSFIHIQDVSTATLMLALNGEPGQSYHVSSRETTTIRDLVDRICWLTGVDPGDIIDEVPDRVGKDQSYLLDTGRIREQFGWVDKISIADGLVSTLQWVDHNLGLLERLPTDYMHKP